MVTKDSLFAEEKMNDSSPPYSTLEPQHQNDVQPASVKCHAHAEPATPYLDAHLANPTTQARMHEITSVLTEAVNGTMCTRCAVESAAKTIAAYVRDVHDEKKTGKMSKEEKKAIKAESKAFLKEMKRDLKKVWKERK